LTKSINNHDNPPASMRMTLASEYGCLALLAVGETEGWCKRQQIAERFDIPTSFLEQILRKLVAAGFIVSRRGADGGYQLSRAASEIVIADVVRAMDGALAPVASVSENFYHPSPVEASVAYHRLFRRVRDAIAAILEETTLEDILDVERTSRTARRRKAGSRDRRVARPATRRR
jgi:Rrf2 family protein